MRATKLGLLLILVVLTSSTALSNPETVNAQNSGSTNPVQISAEQSAITAQPSRTNVNKARVTEHKITATELQALKAEIGVSVEGQNYNQQVGSHGTGLRPPTASEWQEIAQNAYVAESITYPGSLSSVDNSLLPWFPPIGSQGSEGSCVAWSVGYYIKTFQEAKEHGWDLSGAAWAGGQPSVSYQDKIISPEFVYHLINNGLDNGASFQDAINLICSIGASSWQKMPYSQTDHTTWPSEQAWIEAPLYRGNSSGYQYMSLDTDSDIVSLKNWIASGNLATIGVDANKYSNLSGADLWNTTNYVNPVVNHANTVVGYDDNFDCGGDGYGAFKVANSWGVGFSGEKVPDGFYWISYAAMKQRVGATSDAMFYYDLIGYQPQLTATFRIDHAKRGECQITVGVISSPNRTKSFTQYISGGDVPFPANNMAVDITEFKNYVTSLYNQTYFLKVNDGGFSTIGNITLFGVGNVNSTDAPKPTIQNVNVYLSVRYTFVTGEIVVSPTAGPGGGLITLSGSGFTASSSANLSYLNPLTSTWVSIVNNTAVNSTGQFSYGLNAPDLMQSNPSGDGTQMNDSIVFRARDNGNGLNCTTAVPYTEWRRGLTSVGNAVATGLFGNNTNLTSAVAVNVGQVLSLTGKWFVPNSNVTVSWDGATYLGSASANETGFFNASFTVPVTTAGQHIVLISDGSAQFLVTVSRLPLTVDDYDSLWHNSDFTVNLTPDASNAQTYFRINGGQVLSVSVNGQPGITSESSNNTLEYWSVDGLGNEESPHKTLPNIKLDKTAPTGSILINNGANYTKSASVTLTLTSADTLSGVYQVRFRNDGVWATEPWETPSATKTWTLSTGDGEKTVYYQIRDSAGSLTSYSGSITLDTTNPSANAGQNRTVYAGSTVTLDASNCVDSTGVVSYLWDFGDGTTGTGMTTNHTYANTGTYSAKLTVQDSAGNTASSTVAITVQANVIPEFPPVFALFSMLAVTLLAAMVRKKGLSHSEKRNFRLLA